MYGSEIEGPTHQAKSFHRPWWEPYLFTAFVLAGFVVAMMVLGWMGRFPFMEHLLLGLMTLAALFDFFRKQQELPAVAGKLGCALFFGLVGCIYISEFKYIPGIGYCLMSLVWFLLFLFAWADRRRIKKETLAKLDRVIETLKESGIRDRPIH